MRNKGCHSTAQQTVSSASLGNLHYTGGSKCSEDRNVQRISILNRDTQKIDGSSNAPIKTC